VAIVKVSRFCWTSPLNKLKIALILLLLENPIIIRDDENGDDENAGINSDSEESGTITPGDSQGLLTMLNPYQ
jgi:hypothetical protein